MCGIFGAVGPGLRRTDVAAAIAALRHRGPDGWGVWTGDVGSTDVVTAWPPDPDRPWPCDAADLWNVDPARRVLLANTRLGLCGHGPASRQPMTSARDAVITFNGEAYNHVLLRNRLEREGRRFRSGSDTEVLLAGYMEWGPAVVRALEGPFSFAIWDIRAGRLFGARDRFGEKPLYFTHEPTDGRFAFSSSPRALFVSGLARGSVRDDIAGAYLFDRLPPPPGTTFFDDVKQIPPGCTFDFDPNSGHLEVTPFITVESDPSAGMSADIAVLRAALTASLHARRHANSPVALCLSGGIDSANLAAAARSSITCYSATGEWGDLPQTGPMPDERPAVTEVADAVPQAHVEFLPLAHEFTFPNFRRFLDDHDEPPLNSGAFVQWLLMRQVARAGTRAVVTGQGADELFWGYPWHIPSYSRDRHWDRVWREDFGARVPTDSASVDQLEVNALRRQELFMTRLPQHLRDDDTNSMAHGIETRTPYLDSAVVDFAMALPADECFRDRTTKYPVRAVFAEVLPRRVVWGKVKRGLYADCTTLWPGQMLAAAQHSLQTSPVIARIGDTRVLEESLRRQELSRASMWRIVALAHTERAAAAWGNA